MDIDIVYSASVKHFAYALFVSYCGDIEAYKFILYYLDYKERLTLVRAGKTLLKMDDIYGKVFNCYFKKLKEDKVLHSKRDFAKSLLVKSYHFCPSPSFYNFLLLCLFMCHLLLNQPQCLSLLRVVTKCPMIVFKRRYVNFFKANGGFIGMRKYFDQIKNEDLRSFIGRHTNSEEEGILIPTFEDVLNIVKHLDEVDFRNFDIGATDLEFLYIYYYPDEKPHISTDKLKLSSLPPEIDVEEENIKIDHLIYKLDICSEERANRARKRCSYCGEKCFKYLMCQVSFRLKVIRCLSEKKNLNEANSRGNL
ncbi:hypothetical protein CEXT_806751 [Caerostris extrusa]|uniref:Uncharacterized protein n=1 Tax=Caerostris extrusa TaxID=172846 RepID=A0AAV4Q764_CAEEX|nr:hypothetical protein CEXT_806751 [Caerostris extrusa]